MSEPGPRRKGARAFRPRLDESVDADEQPRRGQALLPFAEPIDGPVQDAAGAPPRRRRLVRPRATDRSTSTISSPTCATA